MVLRLPMWLLPMALTLAPAQGRDLRAYFAERCAGCHGVDGSGRGPGGVRLGGASLQDPRTVGKASDEALVAVLLDGRGAMPGFRRQLGEADARRMIAEVVRPLASRKRG